MKKNLLLFILIFSITLVKGQAVKTDTLQYKGNVDNFVNLVILGDGYTASQMQTFVNDATNFKNNFFKESPFKEYQNYFNVFAFETPSNESGAKHPNNASDCGSGVPKMNPDNKFGSTFDAYGIHRLVVPMNSYEISKILATKIPGYDMVFVLVNSTYYGGSGGSYATATMESNSDEIAAHEIGHSFAGLADEYWAGNQYAQEKPNLTKESNLKNVKWKNWVGKNSISLYSHSENSSWYRPHQGCKMRYLGSPFCSVCKEAIVEKIHSLVNPIIRYSPESLNPMSELYDITFSLDLAEPSPNTIKTTWSLDNQTMEYGGKELSINLKEVSSGSHKVAVSVLDTTPLTKNDQHSTWHLYNVVWTINNTVTGVKDIGSIRSEVTVFPVPFSQELSINYSLEKTQYVVISLMDISGKIIKSEIAKQQEKGAHTFAFTGSEIQNLSSGVYFLNLSLDNTSVITQKIIKE